MILLPRMLDFSPLFRFRSQATNTNRNTISLKFRIRIIIESSDSIFSEGKRGFIVARAFPPLPLRYLKYNIQRDLPSDSTGKKKRTPNRPKLSYH